MSGVETLKGFVNTWDCDENGHLNVQFYFRFFEDAASHFQSLARIPARDRREPALRHVRYHAELRENAGVRIVTLGIGGDGAQAAHLLYEAGSDRLSATCIETYARPSPALREALRRHADEPPEAALPRSVDPAPSLAGREDDAPPGSSITLASRIRAGQCRPDGSVFDSAIIGLHSDSAAHFWGMVGVDGAYLEAHGLGRVAVEMKLTRAGRLACGDLVHVVSRPIAVARSTLTFENRFVRTDTGEVDAIVQVTGLTMNLTTRRAAPLPEDLRARIGGLIASR